jgi:putative copper export protein
MKRWIYAAAAALGLSIIVLLGVVAYVEVGRSRGESWSGLAGPDPVWPAALGFGALWAIPISAIVLVVLVVIAIVRAYLPRSSSGG